MAYSVKELYHTLQGEGAHTGRAAVFCRFTGCNLWSGHEKDRAGAVCNFCDTDFVGTDGTGGGKFESAHSLAETVHQIWRENSGSGAPYVVCTGGEPLLQLDKELVDAFHALGFAVAIETNGTKPLPCPIDWVCVSPKAGAELILKSGHEIKLVYPQKNFEPTQFENMDFENHYLQPMDGAKKNENTALTIEYCLKNPKWKLSLQTHKLIGIR